MPTVIGAPLRVPGSWLAEERSNVGPFVTREVYRLEDGSRREGGSPRHRKGHERLPPHSVFCQPQALGWWIAVLFPIGSFLFALGVVPSYATAVGALPDAWTFFVGSLFFTSAGVPAVRAGDQRAAGSGWKRAAGVASLLVAAGPDRRLGVRHPVARDAVVQLEHV